MGYKPKRTLYKLIFEDPDFEGLEITTKRMSVAGLVQFAEMFDTVQELGPAAGKGLKPEHLQMLRDLFAMFVNVLVEWNVEDDDDQPVPRTVDGLMGLDLDFVMPVIEQWISGMTKAPPPLPGNSGSGGISAEEQTLGLAEASRSLQSSSEPS